MKKITRRYSVGENRGGSYTRYFVWDNEKGRMVKGTIGKFEAIGLEHKLNERKFKESI